MPIPFFDLTRQYQIIRDDIRDALDRVLESQTFILGDEVAEFEETLRRQLGVTQVVGVASGTDALLLSLKALDADAGDDVIVPAFTFFATAGAVWNAGLRPVFCDVDSGTFTVTAETLSAAWTARTRAVIPVHLFGQMAPMDEILQLAREREAIVIEDVAQAHGARQRNLPEKGIAGAVGDVGCFSFFPTKNLGGYGDGGAVAANHPEMGERVQQLRVHGGRRKYEHRYVGTNSRLDAIQAAVLSAKAPLLDGWIESRRLNARAYDDGLAQIDGVQVPMVGEGNWHTYNQYTLKAEDRDGLRIHLTERGIGSGVYYPKPLHLQACFSELGYVQGDLPISEELTHQVVSLPIFPELRPDEIDEVITAVSDFYASREG